MSALYTNVPLVATGDWIDASWLNTYLGDNLRALAPYTATGDQGYWDHVAKKLQRRAVGSEGQVWSVTSGLPAWSNLAATHARGVIDNVGTTQSTTSVSLIDVTGASINLSLTRACTVFVVGNVVGFPGSGSGSYNVAFGLLIDGVAVGSYVSYCPFPGAICVAGYRSVLPGTRNVRLRFCSPFGISVTSYGGYLNVFALPE